MTDGLLGRHGEIVEDLLARLDAARAGDTEVPHVVILRGPSGTGKTRIARELYQRLREATAEPVYWPELAGVTRVTASGADPMAARKEITPALEDFVWPAGSLPTFGWWGFNCERLSTSSGQDVVAAARPQLDAHMTPLLMAWRQVADLADKVRARQQEILTKVRDAAVGESSGALLGVLESVGIAVPFAGTLLSWGWTGVQAARQHRQQQEALRTDVNLGHQLGHKQRSAGAKLAGIIRSLTHPRLPAVVVIEDMHLMGPEVAAFVDAVSAPDAVSPVLVIGTVWPEGFDNPDYAGWLERASTRGAVQVADVPPLEEEALVTLLRRYAPATTDDVAHRVVQRLNNPHWLKLWLTLGSTARSIDRNGGKILLGTAEALDLPKDVEQVLLERWKELPERVRDALLYAVAANPLDDPVARFDPWMIRWTSDYAWEFGPVSADDITDALSDACSASWCRRSRSGGQWFTEQGLTALVRGLVDEAFASEEVDILRWGAQVCTGENLAREAEKDLSLALTTLNQISADWFLAAPIDPQVVEDLGLTLALAVARWIKARSAARRSDLDNAISLGQQATDTFIAIRGKDDPQVLEVRTALAQWMVDAHSGDEETLCMLEQLLPDQQRALGDEHWAVLKTRGQIAACLPLARPGTYALPLFESVLADMDRIRAASPMNVVPFRVGYGAQLLIAGRPQEAVTVLQSALDALLDRNQDEIDKPGGTFILRTRSLLAHALGSGGRWPEAVVAHESLVADQVRLLGPLHEDTMATRSELAQGLHKAGRTHEATAAYDALLSDQMLGLGPDDAHTRITRNKIAALHKDAGRIEEAIATYSLLLQDALRLGGPEHPDTLITRRELATCRLEAGLLDKARAELTDVLADQQRLLGPTHPDTYETRYHLALTLKEQGLPDASIEVLTELVEDLQQGPRPTFSIVLRTIHELLEALKRAERGDEAAALGWNFLTLTERLFGVQHPLVEGFRAEMNEPTADDPPER